MTWIVNLLSHTLGQDFAKEQCLLSSNWHCKIVFSKLYISKRNVAILKWQRPQRVRERELPLFWSWANRRTDFSGLRRKLRFWHQLPLLRFFSKECLGGDSELELKGSGDVSDPNFDRFLNRPRHQKCSSAEGTAFPLFKSSSEW